MSALLATLVAHGLLRSVAGKLMLGLGEPLWPDHPWAAVALLTGATGLLAMVWRAQRRRRAGDGDPAPETPESKAAATLEQGLAVAAGGMLAVTVVGGGALPVISPFIGAGLRSIHAWLPALADMALLVIVVLWWWQVAAWRERRVATMPASAAHGLFRTYLRWLAFTLAAAFAFLLWQGLVGSWLRYTPWTLWAAGLACAASFVDSAIDLLRRPTERREVLNDAWQSQLWAQGLAALLVLIVGWVVEGLRDTAQLFVQAGMAERVAFLAMPGLFFVLVAGTVLRLALPGHRVRVFISFQHAREQSAIDLEAALTRAGVVARRIPFRDDHQHDELLRSIQDELRRCDAMVCLPGVNASFVEHEVLVASTLRKFIVFVVGEHEPRLPNTAFYGYPVFRLERVARRRWRAVIQLLQLVAGQWRASLRFLVDSWGRLFDEKNVGLLLGLLAVFVLGSYVVGIAIALVVGGAGPAWAFVRGFHRFYLDLIGSAAMGWAVLNAFLVGSAFALINLLRTRRVLRQETLTGHLTHDLLRDQLGRSRRLNELLGSLWKRPPPAVHEAPH